jgi:hypothetical protein
MVQSWRRAEMENLLRGGGVGLGKEGGGAEGGGRHLPPYPSENNPDGFAAESLGTRI